VANGVPHEPANVLGDATSDRPPATPSPRDPADVVVLCEVPPAMDAVCRRVPGVNVVDISHGLPDGARGEVLYGGRGPASVDAMSAGVRWVQLVGTGIDGLAPEVRAAPVLTSARGAGAVAIGEYVIASLAAFARDFPANWIHEAPDHWGFQPARTLAGATLALYGFGGIGRRVAGIALALEMEVIALRRHRGPSPVEGVMMAESLDELMRAADHLVLAAPATEATHHAVGAASLAVAKPGLHLVNIARGSLVDQEALRRALDDGTVARASLDVTDPEPLPAGHWLYRHPRVHLTPHASWVGPTMEASTAIFCDNLRRYLAGTPLQGVVGDQGY
jgi:phosphoglycerate dehydrogenase-like enzyme